MIASLIGIFTLIVKAIFWIVLSLSALLFLFLFLWAIFHRHTPELTKDVPSSPKNTPPEEVPPPPLKTEKFSESVSLEKDINKTSFIQILPRSCCLNPNEERIFKVEGINNVGDKITPKFIQWQATGGSIDSQGYLIVDPQSKGTFTVKAFSHYYNLSCSTNYIVLPKLTNIEIITTKEIVIPGQDIYLELRGTDQTQSDIEIEGQPIWTTTTGEITSKRKLVVDLPNQIVYITAKIRGLEAKTTIRIGEYPQKVVNYIYPIDIPNPSPKTTPTPNQISIPIIPEHDPEDELSTNEPEQIKEFSRLVGLEIDAPDLIFLKPSQERLFSVNGIDQFGKYIDPGEILWKATGGTIDSQGKLIVNAEAKGRFKLTATSVHTKISRQNSFGKILIIKISLRIFSFILYKKRLIKEILSYFIQEICNLEIEINENLLPESDRDITEILNILIFDNIKDWVIEAVANIIIDYLDKFISLCFIDNFDPLVCSKTYIVLPELKSQGILEVIKTVENSFNTSIDDNILAKFIKIRIGSHHQTVNPGNSIQLYLAGVDKNKKEILIKAPIVWRTICGEISSTGLLTISDFNHMVIVVATVGKLEIVTMIRFYRTYQSKLDMLRPILTSNEIKMFIDNIDCIMQIYPSSSKRLFEKGRMR